MNDDTTDARATLEAARTAYQNAKCALEGHRDTHELRDGGPWPRALACACGQVVEVDTGFVELGHITPEGSVVWLPGRHAVDYPSHTIYARKDQ